jgi:hypothetical protein
MVIEPHTDRRKGSLCGKLTRQNEKTSIREPLRCLLYRMIGKGPSAGTTIRVQLKKPSAGALCSMRENDLLGILKRWLNPRSLRI